MNEDIINDEIKTDEIEDEDTEKDNYEVAVTERNGVLVVLAEGDIGEVEVLTEEMKRVVGEIKLLKLNKKTYQSSKDDGRIWQNYMQSKISTKWEKNEISADDSMDDMEK